MAIGISVADSGIGIPADRRDRLFKSFSQVDPSTTRKFGGTGLGLAVCKQLVELQGGTIGVESEAGRGSKFQFTIRLRRAQAESTTALAGRQSSRAASQALNHLAPQVASAAGRRILIAEDNEVNQLVASAILTRVGFECDIVANGRLAVEAVRHSAYDLVLMDCQMPDMDGFAATRAIRDYERQSSGRPPHLPIVALTASAIKGDREQCLAAGMDAYVTKPIDTLRLIETIETLLAAGDEAAGDEGAQPISGDSANELPGSLATEPSAADVAERSSPVHLESLLGRCTTTNIDFTAARCSRPFRRARPAAAADRRRGDR